MSDGFRQRDVSLEGPQRRPDGFTGRWADAAEFDRLREGGDGSPLADGHDDLPRV